MENIVKKILENLEGVQYSLYRLRFFEKELPQALCQLEERLRAGDADYQKDFRGGFTASQQEYKEACDRAQAKIDREYASYNEVLAEFGLAVFKIISGSGLVAMELPENSKDTSLPEEVSEIIG